MNKRRTKHPVLSWEATGAFCCFSGGMAAALFGTVFTATAWMLGTQVHPWLHSLGTALLIVTIPLLIFSGYCLDWEERKHNKSAAQKSVNGEQESLPN
jgi:membrane protein DedA with SNARE-associated domain